jgi:hypothetical protein
VPCHTETNPPYQLNEDGNGLVPWLLAPGEHRLAVRVDTAGGGQATAAATVDVQARSPLPAPLAGDWERRMTKSDIARTQPNRVESPDELPPAGVWTLHIHPNGLVTYDDPAGSGGAEAAGASEPRSLTLYGPPNWLLPEDRQGSFCDIAPVAVYTWHADGNTLALRGRDPRCADRDAVFTGNWTRTK